MSWLTAALLAPLLWCFSNMLDKFAVSKLTKHWTSFICLMSIGNIFYAIAALAVLQPKTLDVATVALNIFSGFIIFCMYFLYSAPLKELDVSTTIAIHQANPVFVLILSILIFSHSPGPGEVTGFALIALGIIFLTSNPKTSITKPAFKPVILLITSAFFGAVATLISDRLLKNMSLLQVLAFNFLGYGLGGCMMLLVRQWRLEIISDIRSTTLPGAAVFILSNGFDVAGYFFFMSALSLAHNAALVSVIASLHPGFVLIASFLMAACFPRVIQEDISKESILQKLFSIPVICIGVALLATTSD